MQLPQKKVIIPFVMLALIALSCELKQKEFKPEDDWIKIYHHSDPDYKYMPVDFTETENGFLIVNGLVTNAIDSAEPVLNVIEANTTGEVINTMNYNQWYYPVGEIYNYNGSYSIVCADFATRGYLVSLDGTSSNEIPNVRNPLTSYADSSEQLHVLDYTVDASGSAKGSSSIVTLNGGQKVYADISNTNQINGPNEIRPRPEYPIFIGESKINGGNVYHVNMFSGSTLRLIFYNNSNALGDVYSFQGDAAVKAILHKSGNEFILVTYYDAETYINYRFTVESLQEGKRIETEGVEPYPMDLKKNAKMVARRVSFDGKHYGLFATTTASNEIGMLKCTLDSVPDIQEYRFPFDSEVELATFEQDEDGNILVLGQVRVDTYPRTMLMKIPKRKFSD